VSALLQIEDLRVNYGPVLALNGVSLSVAEHESIALLGPNGAGKSTLLRAASGLLRFHGGRVTAGRITYQGKPVNRMDPATLVQLGVAQVLEGRHVFAELSVDENLRAGEFTRRGGRQAARDHVLALFPVLAERLSQPAGLLSGGEQQMLAIGRALMSRPSLLLLDEPSLGLAPIVVRQIGEALRQINAGGVAILLVEQSSALAIQIAPDSYLIETGEIRAQGATKELLDDDRVLATYLGVRS
jgi:branched-chain amino acid transport system ATP-binding protein